MLTPDGCFVLGFRPSDNPAFSARFPAAVYRMHPAAEIETIVADAGFDRVCTVTRQVGRNAMSWVAAWLLRGKINRSGQLNRAASC